MTDVDQAVERLRRGVLDGEQLLSTEHKSLRGVDVDPATHAGWVSQNQSALEDIFGTEHNYNRSFSQVTVINGLPNPSANFAKQAVEILKRALEDVESGYIVTIGQQIRLDVFGDYLEQADHLVSHKYKDAAAVIAGSSLEAHLRALCDANQVDTTFLKNGDVSPKKASRLNADLRKENAISEPDQKQVTAWLATRDNAAHGHYSKVEEGVVRVMVAGIRDFIARNPA